MEVPNKKKRQRTDIYSQEKRSQIMEKIKGKDTSIELKFRQILEDARFKFEVNVKKLPGRPDIVFEKEKIAIFIDGCFWHGCKKHFRLPQSNQWFWEEKISKNVQRDRQINKFYRKMDWTILRIWQHDIKSKSRKTIEILKKIKTKKIKL